MSDLLQLLTPEGQRLHHPDYDVDVSGEDLRGLYCDMVLVRRLDTEAHALQRQGELGLWPPLLGQEAAQIGAGRALQADDYAFPTYREHGVAWTRGVDPVSLLALFRGVTNGGYDPADHGFALPTIVIGDQTLHAVGYAMGVQRDAGLDSPPGSAVMSFFGDGASSQGDVNEAFVWAAVNNAPVVFFCQNNQWAISQPLSRQTRIPLYRRAEGFGFPGLRVDGNDVLAVLALTRAALDRARRGDGPSLIEAYTYRMGAHTTSDDPTRYRVETELEQWRLKDPIERVRAYLLRTGAGDRAFMDEVDQQADDLASRLRQACRDLPDPAADTMFAHVYAEPQALVQQEQRWWREYLGAGDG
jgi:pyruvate dehydrogenase E1 component alpha subunit